MKLLCYFVFATTTAAWIPHSIRHERHPSTPFRSPHHSHGRPRSGRLFLASPSSKPSTSSRELLMYNSKSRRKEPMTPNLSLDDPISMYTCGPTVYDSAHVGNFRAFLTYDVLKRVLIYLGYTVTHVCNITDIDDKILARAARDQLDDVSTLTEHYERLFLDDLASLHCIPATAYPRATRHVPAMVRFVQDLANLDKAYETADGSWYFDTQAHEGYGQELVQLNLEDMEQQKETENSDGKKHFADFCLWKAFKEGADRDDAAWGSVMFAAGGEDGEDGGSIQPTVLTEDMTEMERLEAQQPWPLDTPIITRGRPGWHLECSAMSRTYFGEATLDFHGGGVDLKFPHHENEIAQSQALTNNERSFCNCWFHNGFVETDNEKMSKSLGNFVTLRDACPTAADVRAYRYLVVSSQYRNPLTFTSEVLKAAKKAVQRMDRTKAAVEAYLVTEQEKDTTSTTDKSDTNSVLLADIIPNALKSFDIALCDDLSMPRAAKALFDVIKAAGRELDAESPDKKGLEVALQALNQMDQVFGIFYDVPTNGVGETSDRSDTANLTDDGDGGIPDVIAALVRERMEAKENKDWGLADDLRRQIADKGYAVKDVKNGEPIVMVAEE